MWRDSDNTRYSWIVCMNDRCLSRTWRCAYIVFGLLWGGTISCVASVLYASTSSDDKHEDPKHVHFMLTWLRQGFISGNKHRGAGQEQEQCPAASTTLSKQSVSHKEDAWWFYTQSWCRISGQTSFKASKARLCQQMFFKILCWGT